VRSAQEGGGFRLIPVRARGRFCSLSSRGSLDGRPLGKRIGSGLSIVAQGAGVPTGNLQSHGRVLPEGHPPLRSLGAVAQEEEAPPRRRRSQANSQPVHQLARPPAP
jgi:hypothetical protein